MPSVQHNENPQCFLAFPTAAARDAARAYIPDLASVAMLCEALQAVEQAALPLAGNELRFVAAATARCRATGRGDPALSPFLSTAVPELSLSLYAHHVAKAVGYGAEGLAAGLALMARYAVSSGCGVTPLAMHRLFATCMQLGMKTASDKFVKNVYVAPLVGMSLAELNALELELATVLDFRCLVTAAELSNLPDKLAALPVIPSIADVNRIFHESCTASSPPAQEPTVAAVVRGTGLVELYHGVEDVEACASPTACETTHPRDPAALTANRSVSYFGCTQGPMSVSAYPADVAP